MMAKGIVNTILFVLIVSLVSSVSVPQGTIKPNSNAALSRSLKDFENNNDEYLNYILDAVSSPKALQPIIRQWNPDRLSQWTRYTGTIMQTALKPAIMMSFISVGVCIIGRKKPIFLEAMGRLDKLWGMHFSLSNFFLAFFLNSAKSHYDYVLKNTRSIQGRLNDLNLIAASHATRNPDGTITPEAQEIIMALSRYVRLFSILFYSGICRRYKCLLDDKGLLGLERRGILTSQERYILQELPPKTQYNAVYTWMISTFNKGCENKHCFRFPSNIQKIFLTKVSDLRSSCGSITDALDARCQVSYVHLIQLLVDSFIFTTPFAAVAKMGWFSIPCSFLLSIFFFGLLDLSKILYDPLDNDDFGKESDNVQVDTLVQESNNGSRRFFTTGYHLPTSSNPSPSVGTEP